MHKRQFLRLLSLILLAAGPSLSRQVAATPLSQTNSNPSPNPNQNILVIGAGLAGLAAARELLRHGHQVTILEGRDRIGGRIWTSQQWPDLPVDMGATWIHGPDGNPISALADELNATRLETSYERTVLYQTDGAELSAADEQTLDALRQRVERLLRLAQQTEHDHSVQQALTELTRELAASAQASTMLQFILSSMLEQEFAGSAAQLSAHWHDDSKVFQGEDVFFAKGFQIITDYLAQGLTIVRNQKVSEVRWGGAKVQLVTAQKVWQADQVVVTVPLGVLKQQQPRFIPDLPPAKREAIDKLGMGVLNKCYLRFASPFWPKDVDWLEYLPSRHGEWTEWVSLLRTTNIPVLLGFNAADRGLAIESFSDTQIVDSAMATLRRIFGDDIPEPQSYQITRWAADPFSYGSYSFNAVGSTPAMRKTLAAPLDQQVFFAGEATETDYFGTAHGAYLSGVAAAREILQQQ